MIEFRAECGHTVRAKDHDAGEVVRCTYCGREVQVPLPEDRSLEHLLGQASAEETGGGSRAPSPIVEARQWVKRHGRWVRGALTVAYLAVVLVVVGYGASWVSEMLTSSTKPSTPTVGHREESTPARPQERPAVSKTASNRRRDSGRPTSDLGPAFASLDNRRSGLAVESVPANARVYIARSDKDGTSPANDEKNFKGATPIAVSVPAGKYVVALAMPVTEKALQNLPGYREFRHALEQTRDVNTAGEYFVSDEAEGLTLTRSSRGPLLIVRDYRAEVPDRRGAWTAVTGLFLPDLPPTALADLLPGTDRYTVDAEHAMNELEFYEVAPEERDAGLAMLRQVGKLVVPDGRSGDYRVFQMQPSGQMWNVVARDPINRQVKASGSAPVAENKDPWQSSGRASGRRRVSRMSSS